ncbi:MAG: DUF1499 domain-containing protein [Balneola sp.]
MLKDEANSARFIKTGMVVSLIGALVVVLAGYAYQWGWWGIRFGFQIIPWGTGAAVLGGVIAAIGVIKHKSKSTPQIIIGSTGILIAIIALANLGYWYNERSQGYPPIHDISTNVENPPKFVAIAPLRKDASNPTPYSGEETASQQKEFYSGLEPLTLSLSYDDAFKIAVTATEKMPWEIVDINKDEGRIEAFHKLAWFGFIDDVVIRVDTTATGSIVDIRSKSRIGRGDLGVNAKRIKSFKKKFNSLK